MSVRMRWVSALMPVLALGLVLSGCGKKDEGGAKTGGDGKGAGPGAGKRVDAKVAGYATALKGKVTYNGPEAAMKVNRIKPTKDLDKCPMEVDAEGWYVKDPAAKGIRYAVVYLKAPKDIRMPKADEEKNKPASPVLELRQPKCQFEPRVMVMHPSQSLKVFNDSQPAIPHDSNVNGPNTITKTMVPGTDATFQIDPNNTEPNKVACGIHTGTMSAYIWKFDHPWAAVTDENGNYEIKNVPVLEGAQLELWVWHEMMDPKTKKIGAIEVKAGEAATKDLAIPN